MKTFHFSAPMNLVAALSTCSRDVVLCGNLDPTAVFVHLAPADVAARTALLLTDTAAHRNFVISSGCDVPPNAPLSSLDAFYQAVDTFNRQATLMTTCE